MFEETKTKIITLFNKYNQDLNIAFLNTVLIEWNKNDPAHRHGHLLAVLFKASKIIDAAPKGTLTPVDIKCILFGALLHDIAVYVNRKRHHLIGEEIAYELLVRKYDEMSFTEKEIDLICLSVKEHRASYKEPRSGIVSEVVSLADRGELCFDTFVTRTVESKIHKHEFFYTGEELANVVKSEVIESMVDKFSKNGYCWKTYPKVPWVDSSEEITKLSNLVEDEDCLEDKIDQVIQLNLDIKPCKY